MRKLGPPERGFGNIRPLTRREREITGLSSVWCIGRDGRGELCLYERNGTGYDYGYGPRNANALINKLIAFWGK